MKKNLFFAFCFSCFLLRAQSHQTIGYHAIARDEQGQLVINRLVGVRITVLRGTLETSLKSDVYEETHTPTTNGHGTFALKIGGGIATPGNSFEAIDWSDGHYAIQIEIDLNGGTNYTLTSMIDVLSVPLALHAQTAQRLVENPQETDPIFTASVAKTITDTNVAQWNKKLDSIDLKPLLNSLQTKADTAFTNTLQTNIEILQQTKVDSAYVNAKLKNLETGMDTALLNALLAKVETLEKSVEDLQTDLQIANGTLVKDIDGNIYKTQKYGNQTWMIENLRVSKYNDGTKINYVQNNSDWLASHYLYYHDGGGGSRYSEWVADPMYCFADTSVNGMIKYGAFYNWFVVDPANGKQLCPVGWHVPSIEEWDILRQQLIADGYNYDSTTTGNKIGKSMAMGDEWKYSPIAGSAGNTDFPTKKNSSNFSAFPAGYRGDRNGNYFHVNEYARWWSASSRPYNIAPGMIYSYGRYVAVRFDTADMFICPYGSIRHQASSIRCVQD